MKECYAIAKMGQPMGGQNSQNLSAISEGPWGQWTPLTMIQVHFYRSRLLARYGCLEPGQISKSYLCTIPRHSVFPVIGLGRVSRTACISPAVGGPFLRAVDDLN